MSARVNTVNRAGEALLGLVLLVAGALGLAVGFGAFGDSDSPLLPQGMRDFAKEQPWFWWVVAVGCLLLALLGLLWLLAQLRTDRASRMDLTTDGRDGLTTVHTRALADAVESETESVRGVAGASASVIDRKGRRLSLTVDLTEYADIPESPADARGAHRRPRAAGHRRSGTSGRHRAPTGQGAAETAPRPLSGRPTTSDLRPRPRPRGGSVARRPAK